MGAGAVQFHLLDQGFGIREALVLTNEVDELDLDLLTVKIAVEIEKEYLKDGRAVIERGPGAKVCRAVVALLTADPELARGKHLFECPMATGYKKWVQTSEEISNPYMGKAMPACGAAAEW